MNDIIIFPWLTNDWWIENPYSAYEIIDNIAYLLFLISVLYVFIFAFFSLKRRQAHYPPAQKKHRFAVIFPAYKEDSVILNSVQSFLKQKYPQDKYDIIVVSDQMQPTTNEQLAQLPVKLFIADYAESTKTKALQFAMSKLNNNSYDVVVLLDADNIVKTDYLEKLNDAYYSGGMAIQTHRVAKNMNTNIAVLDAVSEEINNSIFRKGHVRLGFSSALIGSGMSFEFNWFKKNVNDLSHIGFDKHLETKLLKQRIYIEYLEDVYVYDEKIQTSAAFYSQRRRWQATQYENLKLAIQDFPEAFVTGNFDYCDKLIQWMMPPRVILLGLITIISCCLTFINFPLSLRWWGLLTLLLISFSIAVPDNLVNNKFRKALVSVPLLFLMMLVNYFKLKDGAKKFIHTEHSENLN